MSIEEQNTSYYIEWLKAGRSPEEIKHDLMSKGFNKEDALRIMRHIDDEFLSSTDALRPVKVVNGIAYKILGWLIIGMAVVSALFLVSVLLAWFVFTAIAGVGFALVRYGYYVESSGLISRQRGFARKFKRR